MIRLIAATLYGLDKIPTKVVVFDKIGGVKSDSYEYLVTSATEMRSVRAHKLMFIRFLESEEEANAYLHS